jgi:histidinol-phosphate aminotransferase
LVLPWVDALPPYVPGKPPVRVPGVVPAKLSSNENPTEPLLPVLQAATEALADVNRYPDPQAAELVSAVAALCETEPENVAVGPGSVALLQQIVQITAGEGHEVVHAWRSFEAYPLVTAINGAVSVPVALDARERHDLDAMARAVGPRTRLVLLCSPNNPTGTTLRAADVHRFLSELPEDVLVVLDEAYAEFVRDDSAVDGLDVWTRYPNVAVLRTFSKAYGLAGLRVGYVVGQASLVAALRSSTVPFAVPAVSQAAALASLRHRDALLTGVEDIVRERHRVQESLMGSGVVLEPSQGNFVWLRLGDLHEWFLRACADASVAVRPYGTEGVRVTIGTRQQNDRFLDVVESVLRSEGAS